MVGNNYIDFLCFEFAGNHIDIESMNKHSTNSSAFQFQKMILASHVKISTFTCIESRSWNSSSFACLHPQFLFFSKGMADYCRYMKDEGIFSHLLN